MKLKRKSEQRTWRTVLINVANQTTRVNLRRIVVDVLNRHADQRVPSIIINCCSWSGLVIPCGHDIQDPVGVTIWIVCIQRTIQQHHTICIHWEFISMSAVQGSSKRVSSRDVGRNLNSREKLMIDWDWIIYSTLNFWQSEDIKEKCLEDHKPLHNPIH